MKCEKCGSEISIGRYYCDKCGNKMKSSLKITNEINAKTLEEEIQANVSKVKDKANNNEEVESKKDDDGKAYVYLLVAEICFIISGASIFVPYLLLSVLGVIVSLSLAILKCPKKTYLKVLLIIYVSLVLLAIPSIIWAFKTCNIA